MTLQVSFDQFAATVERLLGKSEAYVSSREAGTLVTAANPDKSIVVATLTPLSADVATASLKDLGLEVHQGCWLTPEEVMSQDAPPVPTYIAAVAYKTANDKAGVWIDAYSAQPTQVVVLRAMYDEFTATGEIDELPFEEFVQLANANVVIVSPSEIEGYLKQKEDC